MSALQVRLLGGLALEYEGRALPPLPTRAARSLFALLVTDRDRPHHRDRLVGQFWPDLPEARARRRLSHALWQIQQVLAELPSSTPFLSVDADTVRVAPDAELEIDVDDFERLSNGSQNDLERAVEMYRGDFLAGIYDDWVVVPQQRLRARYADLLRRAIDGCKAGGDLRAALGYARRLVSHDPLDENAHRHVMRLSFLLGRFNDAIQQYEFCISILEEELATQPAAETTALYESIVAQRAKGERPFVPQPRSPLFRPTVLPLVGRVEERALVVERMGGAFAGKGGVVLTEGAPGVGITRFLDGLATDAHWRGMGVLAAAAGGSDPPYGLAAGALGGALSALRVEQLAAIVQPLWLRAAALVLPQLATEEASPLPRLNPEDERDRLSHALTEILLAMGTVSPHVVILDDVHRADPSSLAWLRDAARKLHSSNILMVVGYHSAEARSNEAVWSTLLDIDAQRGTDRLPLHDLDPVETTELITAATGAPADPALVDSVLSQTGGNPLLVLETLRNAASTSLEDPPLTVAATDLLDRRLQSSSRSTIRVLQAISVLDGPVPVRAVARLAGLPRDVALDAISDAVAAALAVEDGDGIRVAHAQLRAAVGRSIEDEPVLHRRAARWLESSRLGTSEQLARHLMAAGEPAAAMAAFERAANEAAGLFSFEMAARHVESALDAAGRAGVADVSPLLLRLESFGEHAGDRKRQGEALDRLVAADLDPPILLETLRRRVLWLAGTDRFEDADATAEQGLRLADEHGLPVGPISAARGIALSWSGRPGDALPHLRRAIEQSDLDPQDRAEAQHAFGHVLSSFQPTEAQLELEAAAALYRELGQRRRVADVLGAMATNDASRGRLGPAEARLREAYDICRRIGFRPGEALHLSNLATLHFLDGRVAEALRGFEAALAILDTTDDPRRRANTLSNSAYVRYRIIGDDESALEMAAEALRYYESVGNPRGTAQAIAIVGGVMARRRPAEALALLEERLADVDSYGPWTAAHLERRIAEVRLAAGDIDGARQHCDRGRSAAEAAGLDDVSISLDGLASRIALAAGDGEGALVLARRAVAGLGRGVDQPYLLHLAHYRAATDPAEGQPALEAAYRSLQTTLRAFTLEERASARRVPEHAAIFAAWASRHPITEIVELPAAGTAALVEVEITIASPDDAAIAGKRPRRLHRLRRALDEIDAQGARPATAPLAVVFGVSPATLRRDLATMRSPGSATERAPSTTTSAV
jgi:DNA-binding SARP family transcriptional activator